MLSALGLVGITLAVYASGLRLWFVGDDFLILRLIERTNGLGHAASYFRVNFFGFYRPLAFLSQAFDWSLWGENAVGFHLTNLLLHVATSLFVFGIARRLLGPWAALAAALLFSLHASNEEAVFWVSARFDLLATFWMAAGLWIATRTDANLGVVSCFALALLSKESAFSFPLIVGAYDVFIRRAATRQVVRRLALLLSLVAGYTLLRSLVGGPELGASLGRFAKVGMLGAGMAALIVLASIGWDRVSAWLASHRRTVVRMAAASLAAAACLSVLPVVGPFVRPKLTFASFVLFYLGSPLIDLPASPLSFDPSAPTYWLAALAASAAIAFVVLFYWKRLTTDPVFIFAVVFTVSALIPVSSMTEGKRYLYLASIGTALLVGFAVDRLRPVWWKTAAAVIALVLAVSIWQIETKAAEWAWAGRMTRDAVGLVGRLRGAACVGDDVVLLTAPVAVHDVYSHLYRDTFIRADGCGPRSVRTLIRVVGHDVSMDAVWANGARKVEMTMSGDRPDLVTSRDLRHFDVPLQARPNTIETVAGRLEYEPHVGSVSLGFTPSGGYDAGRTTFLYFSRGAIHFLAPPPAQ
jgi:hypothetical protein